jgi:hypothetical protein
MTTTDEILHILAKRIRPNYLFVGKSHWLDFVETNFHCLICDELIIPGILSQLEEQDLSI